MSNPDFEHIRFEQQADGLYVPKVNQEFERFPATAPNYDFYFDALDQVNDSFAVIEDPVTGQKFEFFGANLDKAAEEFTLFGSTEYSSATQNIGNVIEFAAASSVNRNVARGYVAYPGNGFSENLKGEDRKYFKQTGRFTRGVHTDPESFMPLETMAAATRAVEAHVGHKPNHFSGDVAGGRFALGMGMATEGDGVKDFYINGPTGVSPTSNFTAKLAIEDVKDRLPRRSQKGYIPGEVTGESQKDAKEHLGKIYKGKGHNRAWLSTYGRALPNVLMNSKGHGNKDHMDLEDLENHALAQDLLATLVTHEAVVTMQINRKSAIHKYADVLKLGRVIMQNIPEEIRSQDRGIELLIGTGTLDAHTTNPGMRTAAERKGLSSIARFFRIIMLGDDKNITVIPPKELEEAQV